MSAGEQAGGRSGRRKWAGRIGWFVLLWCAGVTALAGVGWLIRMTMPG